MALNKREQHAGAAISSLAIALLLIYLSLGFLPMKSELALLSAIGMAILGAFALGIFMLLKYRRRNDAAMIDYLNVGVQRYILALLMVMYGIDKLLGNFFDYQLFALDSKLGEVSEFQLAWFFYGKNRWQELLAGIMEFVPGIFLFHRRTYYIAALVLLPVTAQVFLLNLFFKIGGITFPVASILLACNSYIIYSQKEAILQFFRSLNFRSEAIENRVSRRIIRILRVTGIVLAALFVMLKLRPLVFKSEFQQKYQRLVGVWTLKDIRKNGIDYRPLNDSLVYKDLYIEKQSRWNILRESNDITEAFVLRLNTTNDSIGIFINKGGMGDQPDIIDSTSALRGVYVLNGNALRIHGTQGNDTLELRYERQQRVVSKTWFW